MGEPHTLGITLLRSILNKLSSPERAALVFDQHARPRPGSTPVSLDPPEALCDFVEWMTGYKVRHGDPLTRDDRVFLWRALNLWLGRSSTTPVPITVLGIGALPAGAQAPHTGARIRPA